MPSPDEIAEILRIYPAGDQDGEHRALARLISAGCSYIEAKEALGHHVDVTREAYRDVTPLSQREAIAILSAVARDPMHSVRDRERAIVRLSDIMGWSPVRVTVTHDGIRADTVEAVKRLVLGLPDADPTHH